MKMKCYHLLIGLFCFTLMSFVKPGQAKNVVHCELYFDLTSVFPGNLVELKILTTLKDSSVVSSSESNLGINFSDYEFACKGGVEIYEKSRTKLIVKVLDEVYEDAFVVFSIKLRKNKEIHYEVRIPVRYDLTQKVSYAGTGGYDPRSTTSSGFRKIPLTKRVNIEFIDNTQTLTNNSDPAIIGGKGPDLDVYVSLVETTKEKKFLKVEIKNESGEQLYKYLPVGEGRLDIESLGGKGGISKNGGKGGDGGNITVFLTPKAKPYFKQIYIFNYGGEGGELWRPKIDGQQQGPYGDDGKVTILDWQ